MRDIIIDKSASVEPFDYSTLDADDRAAVEIATGGIRDRVGRAMADIIEIGQRLAVVKERLGHGNFGAWLAAEFDWSHATAAKMIRVGQQFKIEPGSNLKIAPAALYMLAAPSIEPEARDEAVARARSGEKITPSVAKEIATKAATAKGKPTPVKVTRKDAEPRTDAPPTPPPKPAEATPTFTDADNPFADDAEPVVLSAEPPPEPIRPKPAPSAQPWDGYNAGLSDIAKEAEGLARKVAGVAGFNSKGQASVEYANGLLTYEGTVGVLRSFKRTLQEARIAGMSGARAITEREAEMKRHAANARKVSA